MNRALKSIWDFKIGWSCHVALIDLRLYMKKYSLWWRISTGAYHLIKTYHNKKKWIISFFINFENVCKIYDIEI